MPHPPYRPAHWRALPNADIAARTAEGFLFALTYGPNVDWYRNVQAAGQATLRWQGQEYTLERPQAVDASTGQHAFPFPLNLILRLLGTRHFFEMTVTQNAEDKVREISVFRKG